MAKYTELSNQILDAVGGKDNVSSAVHCMSRLRLSVKDRSRVDVEAVKSIKGVVGAQFSGEQFQVIIGQHVSDVYPEFCKIAGISAGEAIDENLDKEPFSLKAVPSKILDYVSGSIVQTIPIMMGAGFFKMFYAILGPDLMNVMANESQFMQTIHFVGEAGFYFMPVFVAWGAAKKLNTSIPIALLLGVLLLDPNFMNIVAAGESFKIYGFIPMELNSYAQTVIPILLSVWALKYVWSFFNKIMPNAIKVIGVPFCVLVIMIPLMYCGLAPIGNWISEGITVFINTLYDVAGPLAIAFIGAFWMFMVATGMHIAVIQIAFINIATLGYDPIVLAGSNISLCALMGMVVAYFIRSKGEEKQIAGANAITLLVGGISEPSLFGILLRNKKAMLVEIVGGFIGGLVGGILGVAVYTLGAANVLVILQYAGGPAQNFINACIACAVAFIVSLVMGLIIGFNDNSNGKGFAFLKKK
ncbi:MULTISPECIES: PTS transporter subunit EIIC [unclassified Breznakia]|uniref:PTS transporter subunit EIIC n=1 Tax=unclassified Breznakia TaxID=2623764 RepID=UPI002476860B|nr:MULTISPECIES: PTS transporter subunit EIIC [unclassified Breznakia]